MEIMLPPEYFSSMQSVSMLNSQESNAFIILSSNMALLTRKNFRLIPVRNQTGVLEMSRNVQSGNTQNLKSMVIQRSFPKWSVAERRKTAAASDQAAVCACAHSRYFAGGSPSGLRV